MKRNLLVLFFLAFTVGIYAQIISLEPNNLSIVGEATSNDLEGYVYINNLSGGEISLRWRKSLDGPAEWESWVCDENLCYTDPVLECPENKPIIIPAGGSSPMIGHVDPNEYEASGVFTVEIFLSDEPDNTLATAVYTFETSGVVSTTIIETSSDISLYPNPATDFFAITDNDVVEQIELFNIVGKKLSSFYANNNQFDISSLSTGMYLVRLINEDDQAIKTLRLYKR